jgi:pyrimidine-nucleoside phosphorylase
MHSPRTLVELLSAKRDGGTLDAADLRRLVASFMDGALADYQMAAFLMAVFFRGLDDAETVALTEAMLHSGRVLDLSRVPGFKVDKHSTGGVGDKISICLAPLVAACGVPVPMVSGRGLGHTGGTLDKLEAIPGFRTDLSADDFARIVGDVGTCMIGQTQEIAPADKRIYALRDVTATVECIPLIVASILSKKLAEGIDGLVLDVKVGRGAFMKDTERATALATALVRVGTRAGKRVVAVLTDMDTPLGVEVGNASETREALEVLHGRGPADVVECTMVLGAEMLVMGGKAKDAADARALLERAIARGDAVRTMERMVEAQGGDPRVVADPSRLVVAMGAGRARADAAVDPAVGISVDVKPGARVAAGDVLARVHVRDEAAGKAIAERIRGAYTIDAQAHVSAPATLVRGRIEA